ncbi:MAG: hypothetical protein QOE29_1615 [Gaiellaceae bacterium]|nr:hypothetical protein [Gaiellaceae bacterium]
MLRELHDLGHAGLHASETLVDRLPAGADQVDEEGQILDARRALCGEVALEVLETADQLIRQAAELRHLAAERLRLGADPVPDCLAHLLRQRRLERGTGLGERLDLRARPLERRVDVGRLRPGGGRFGEPILNPLPGCVGHRRGG